jgi:hypothetical protein
MPSSHNFRVINKATGLLQKTDETDQPAERLNRTDRLTGFELGMAWNGSKKGLHKVVSFL